MAANEFRNPNVVISINPANEIKPNFHCGLMKWRRQTMNEAAEWIMIAGLWNSPAKQERWSE